MSVIILTIALLGFINRAVSEIDLRYLDETVNPCDDFYQFACGNFGNYNTRPESQDTLDIFSITENELVQLGKEILSSPKTNQDPVALKKAKSAYNACVDVPKTDDLFYYQTPERAFIEEYGGLPLIDNTLVDKVSFSQISELAGKTGIPQLFKFTVKNFTPQMYIIIMFPDSFDEPQMIRPETAKSYDKVLDESLRKLAQPSSRKSAIEEEPLSRFLWNITKTLQNMHGNNVYKDDFSLKNDLEEIRTFMVQLFSGGIIDDDMVPPGDVVTLQNLQDWTDEQFGDEIDINWFEFFQQQFKWANMDVSEEPIYLTNASSIYGILNLIRKTKPSTVKNFILLRTFLYMAPDSDSLMRQAFEEYYTALGFQYYERSEYCARKILDVVDSISLSFAVTSEFTKYHFNINKLPLAVQVWRNTQEIFKNLLTTLDWIDDETRITVLQKINNIVVFLGYPEFVDNTNSLDNFYENVQICEWDNYGNAQRIRAFKKAYALTQYENFDLWITSPFEVNAYAIRASNRIMAPLAMLHSAYFKGADPVYDYSRFGTIIAHELIHHFDSGGIVYDQDGQQKAGLLSNSSSENFEERTQCFEDQYSSYYVSQIGAYLNGANTLDENLADNGGTKHAYAAFLKYISPHLEAEAKSSKYNLKQQFFISFANVYCSEESDAYLQDLVSNNGHAPNRFRVIGTLSNMEEFAEAFNCPVGSEMNPENKCSLW